MNLFIESRFHFSKKKKLFSRKRTRERERGEREKIVAERVVIRKER